MKRVRGAPGLAALDPGFRPPLRALGELRAAAREAGEAHSLAVALERPGHGVSRHELQLVPPDHPMFPAALSLAERWVKLLLWSRGAAALYVAGDPEATARIEVAYGPGGPRAFDRSLMERVYGNEFEVLAVALTELPEARESRRAIGGNFAGNRIGFDLGASDYKVAAVIDGRVVFTEETPWRPREEPDPGYHLRHIRDALDKAAAHLPRVDAIGGSAAGIYVDNRVKVASIFRAVPRPAFDERVENMFVALGQERGVPLTVINDGDAAALAGSLTLDRGAILGIALGSSEAGGYIDGDGRVAGWLNELAFAPVDLNPRAPVEEWSGDTGVGASYFSQQAVFRLAEPAALDIELPADPASRLERVQAEAERGADPARKVFETIGTYLGHTVPWYYEVYRFETLLLLGRVVSGSGGEIIRDRATAVLSSDYPSLAERVALHMPDEKSRRIGQAVAAASLPAVP